MLLQRFEISRDDASRIWDVTLDVLVAVAVPAIMSLVIVWQIIHILAGINRYELYLSMIPLITILAKAFPLLIILAVIAPAIYGMWKTMTRE